MTSYASLPETGPTITIEDFLKFKEFFYRRTGISFEASKRYFVDKRLVERIEATGTANFRSYFTMLRFQASGEELQQLTNLMTVNETYFLREEYQFKCWSTPSFRKLSETGTARMRFASGAFPPLPGGAVFDRHVPAGTLGRNYGVGCRDRVVGYRHEHSSPCTRRPLFGSLGTECSGSLAGKVLQGVGDEYQLSDDLRHAVEFTRVNLSEAADTLVYRNFDVIFCRNLLIYFDDVSRTTAAETFYEAMNPGGFICLGHSESMSRISSLFKVRKFPDAIVYQKGLESR